MHQQRADVEQILGIMHRQRGQEREAPLEKMEEETPSKGKVKEIVESIEKLEVAENKEMSISERKMFPHGAWPHASSPPPPPPMIPQPPRPPSPLPPPPPPTPSPPSSPGWRWRRRCPSWSPAPPVVGSLCGAGGGGWRGRRCGGAPPPPPPTQGAPAPALGAPPAPPPPAPSTPPSTTSSGNPATYHWNLYSALEQYGNCS